jgi:hypothetical protein
MNEVLSDIILIGLDKDLAKTQCIRVYEWMNTICKEHSNSGICRCDCTLCDKKLREALGIGGK